MSLTGNILITGGSGTLGHAIVRTAKAAGWDCDFTIYSRSELRQAEMRQRYPSLRYVLGDVRDYDRLSVAVLGHDLVIHAAAVKRIPEAESQPINCFETNVLGSANVVRACIAGNVPRCVGISTDKACAAITTYGASKRIMEGLFLHSGSHATRFTLCRYGNVLGSNGSVIPLWRQQAAAGKPLTITDRRMTRFWMTERDAVAVIERATAPMAPCAIIVPKMHALDIETMAQYVVPGCDTVETGLRSTEKLHEDLVHPFELALEAPDTIWVGDGAHMTTGHSYTSETAPRISAATFHAMLAEGDDA